MSTYAEFLAEKVNFDTRCNEGDLIYDPFGGLFTVPVRALALGREGRAAELNPGYFLDGVKYLQAAERKRGMPSLFDLEPEAVA